MDTGDNADRVVIVDSNAIFVRGLAGFLADASIAVDEPSDVTEWARGIGRRGALVAMMTPGAPELVAGLRAARADLAIVALVATEDPLAYCEALHLGVSSAVWRGSPPSWLLTVLEAALDDHSLLPSRIVQLLAVSLPVAAPQMSETDRELLRSLASGQTVRDLAKQMSYSDRALHRRLSDLYERIGASNRAHAIVLATRWGIVNEKESVAVDLRGVSAQHRRRNAASHRVSPPSPRA